MNKLKTLVTSLALMLPAVALANPTGGNPADASAALDRINAAGQYSPYELEYRHGHWTAEGTTAQGVRVDLLVDSNTGQVHAFDERGSGAIDSRRVQELVQAAGYARVRDMEFDDGFWEVEAIDSQGREIDLVLHPISGEILNGPSTPGPGGAAPLNHQQVLAALTQAGYTQVKSLDYDDKGYWEAEAINPQGQRVDVDVDPYNGSVLREEIDD